MNGQDAPCWQASYMTLGNALLYVSDPQFLRGYTFGYREGYRTRSTQLLGDTHIVYLLRSQWREQDTVQMWHAGYVLGWLTALHGIPRIRHFCTCDCALPSTEEE